MLGRKPAWPDQRPSYPAAGRIGRSTGPGPKVWSLRNRCMAIHASAQQNYNKLPGSTVRGTAQRKLFSNLDSKLKPDPGSVVGSALLIAGTTVGAGILALPAVTQEAGFVPAATTLTGCCLFSIATGLLVSEVHLNIMRQQGAGNVSLVTMARQTLGDTGALAASAAYVFLHHALLVAYMSKAGEIAGDTLGLPLLPAAALFAGSFALLCYGSSQRILDQVNGALVALVVASFLGLLGVAGSGIDAASLVSTGDWSAVPATLPVVALAFVYHNIVPVVNTALEGDVTKIRTAVVAGVAIPWAMFVSWEAAILGSLGSLTATQPTDTATSPPVAVQQVAQGQQYYKNTLKVQQLVLDQQVQQQLALYDLGPPEVAPAFRAESAAVWCQQQQQQQQTTAQYQLTDSSFASRHQNGVSFDQSPATRGSSNRATDAVDFAPPLAASPNLGPDSPRVAVSTTAPARSPAAGASAAAGRVSDPLAALSALNPLVAPLIQAFSFLAIATSYIGFILGLTDFLADALALPGGRQSPLPYLITIVPPLAVAVTNPDIFLKALDTAGTYGVLTLFGMMPAAMAWSQRYGNSMSPAAEVNFARLVVVPGGRISLLCIGGAAAGIIGNELLQLASKL